MKVAPEEQIAAVGTDCQAHTSSGEPKCVQRPGLRLSFEGARHNLKESSQARMSSQMLVEVVSGISRAPDDTNLMGLTPAANRTKEECKEQIAARSMWQNASVVLTRFWLYFLFENLYAIIPLILALVPVVAGGALANELIESLPNTAGKYDDFKDLTSEHSTNVMVLAYVQAVVTPIGLYGMPCALVCTLWSWKALLKPVLLKFLLPGFLVSLVSRACAEGFEDASPTALSLAVCRGSVLSTPPCCTTTSRLSKSSVSTSRSSSSRSSSLPHL